MIVISLSSSIAIPTIGFQGVSEQQRTGSTELSALIFYVLTPCRAKKSAEQEPSEMHIG